MSIKYQSLNPATGEIFGEYPLLTDSELVKKLEVTLDAYRSWKNQSLTYRSDLMNNAARILREKKETYGQIITLEMGKPITQAIAEVEKCALVCDYYAENAESFLTPRKVTTDAYSSYVRYDPLGPVFAIMPWNFPFWQVFRFAAPNLMAGNAGILKHAPNVPGSALAIVDIFREAGFPEDIFQNLFIDNDQAARVIRDPSIQGVTLTGSDAAGRAVAQSAGAALKKSVLELGGSDPFIVLKDADLNKAADAAITSRYQNAGQSCIAAKRFIVAKEVYEKFIEIFTSKAKALKVGDPSLTDTDVGPMARNDLREELHKQVASSKDMGADVLFGGDIMEGSGFFYPITILGGVKPRMTAAREETFGPISTFIEAENEVDAIQMANDTYFGLGASLWTSDLDLAEKLAPQIESGSVFINAMVKSDVRLPFGGIKQSGYGRELSEEGIREFINIKTVLIQN